MTELHSLTANERIEAEQLQKALTALIEDDPEMTARQVIALLHIARLQPQTPMAAIQSAISASSSSTTRVALSLAGVNKRGQQEREPLVAQDVADYDTRVRIMTLTARGLKVIRRALNRSD